MRFETQGSKTIVLIDTDGSSGRGRAVSFLTLKNISATALNNAKNFALIRTTITSIEYLYCY
ncbi:hypothetical protein WKK05_08145 [Nostoc sp. UHCC 0302]|uniref:hypothetical protein n=1 Tax=Nostoc sp. UHCC 0302 TaxID=3134896 RepID=UPI00311CC43D